MSQNIKNGLKSLMIKDAPAYANKFFYSLGFLSATSFLMLIVTGVIMSLYGPQWWLTSTAGRYLRSVHLWSTQAFVLFILLHLLIVFFTSAFKKPRRLTWIIGVFMLLIVLAETEFGFVLRGDFSSQWRGLQGADFYNGSGLGYWLNTLSYKQIYGIHIAVVPFLIVGLLCVHYFLVRVLGIAKPTQKGAVAKTVPANHKLLFVRGGMLIVGLLVIAIILPSPYIKATTISGVANEDPNIIASALVKEMDGSSDTAGYKDSIAPYTFDVMAVYVSKPLQQLNGANATDDKDLIAEFNLLSKNDKEKQLKDATDFFEKWDGEKIVGTENIPEQIVGRLVNMAKSGLYEPALAGENEDATPGDNSTYVQRFLADTGVLEEKATGLNLTTDQYGMLHEEGGHAPGAWWLAPIGILNHTVLSNDDNGDRDAAIIFGSMFLLFFAFPFIPGLNQLPEKLKVYKLIWHEKKPK